MQERFKCLGDTDTERRSVIPKEKLSQICNACYKSLGEKCFQCSVYHAVQYCDSKCQKVHWKEHKKLCMAIKELSRQEDEKNTSNCEFKSHIHPKKYLKIVNLE